MRGVVASLLALCAVSIVGARGSAVRSNVSETMKNEVWQEIGVEHSTPASMRWSVARKGHAMRIECGNDGDVTVLLSLPAGWELEEVRGMALASVQSDPPASGFIRWHVQSGATLSFSAGSTTGFLFHNASATPLSIHYALIDLPTGKSESGVLLLDDKTGRLRMPPE